jgi:cargo-transport protein YPP1
MKQEKKLILPGSEERIAHRRKMQDGVVGEADNETVREAVELFEQCLMYFPNHPGGIVGLSNVLLDYYERKVELGRKVDDSRPKDVAGIAVSPAAFTPIERPTSPQRTRTQTSIPLADGADPAATNGIPASNPSSTTTLNQPGQPTDDDLRKTPENLNRLAARDRAYGLLSTLTKLGSGWDNSEAWYALARAHELGGELEKAKEILWWVVKLEDTKPLRPWSVVGGGKGYVL